MEKNTESKVYFNGTGDVQSFVEKVELMAALKDHKDAVKATFIASRLTGTAFDVYRRMSAEDKKDPEKIKTNLLKEFCREERNREEALNALMQASRKTGETTQAFSYRILKLVQLAYSSLDAGIQNTIARDYFMKGLSSDLQVAVKSVADFKDKTLQLLSDEATRLEIAGVGSSKPESVATVGGTSETDWVEKITAGVLEKLVSSNLLGEASGGNEPVNAVFGNRGRGRGNFRGRTQSRGRGRGPQNNQPGGSQNNQSGKRCRTCQSTSHLFRTCPVRHCQACGGQGHDAWSTTCPNYS